MFASLIGRTPSLAPGIASRASQLTGHQRLDLALLTLTRQEPLSQLAAQTQVSRKFCYQQAHKARGALEAVFVPPSPNPDVLYYLPVTREWIEQVALAFLLIGHGSERGALDFLAAVIDYPHLSLGSVHNLLMDAADRAGTINAGEDLSGIRVGALDEIYQGRRPVLAGVDVESLYCFLMSLEEQCDGDTWGTRMLELSEQRGLNLHRSIADAGRGLRSGQAQAWPGVPCLGDVFHLEREFEGVVGFLKHRWEAAQAAVDKLQAEMNRLQQDMRCSLKGRRISVGRKLHAAQAEAEAAHRLYLDIALLSHWMRQDVLAVAGAPLAVRQELYDFVLAELRRCEVLCPQRLTRLRRALEEQRPQLLEFLVIQEAELAEVAERLEVPLAWVEAIAALEALDPKMALYWQRCQSWQRTMGGRFAAVESAVRQVLADTQRSSSLVENLNGRLRCCFLLRRHISQPYLDLLRFYFNHHPLIRSQCPRRQGKSPWQLLGGHEHPHWLEMLGYRRFRRS